MSRKLKFSASLLVMMLSFASLSGVTSAKEVSKIKSDELLLEYEGHGSFNVSSADNTSFNTSMSKTLKSKDVYKVKKKRAGGLYELSNAPKDFPFNKVMEVKENKFLAVGEMEVTPLNIQSVVEDSRISLALKEDLKDLMEDIKKRELNDTTVTIYSPDLIEAPLDSNETSLVAASGWESQYTSYYTGYNGNSYKDEWFYISNYASNPGTQELTPKADAQAFYKKVFNHYLTEGVSLALSKVPMGWIPTTLYEIFGADSSVGGNTNDKLVVTYTESKYRKYTSISWLGVWNFAAATENVVSHKVNFQKIAGGNITNKQDSFANRPTKSWSIADQRAYQMRDSTTFWDERYKGYNYFGISFSAP